MLAVAILGWAVALFAVIRAGQWYRKARAWRLTAEALMRAHCPDQFAKYSERLARHGDAPLVTEYEDKHP